MKPIIPLNSKIEDPAIILDQELSDARKHKIQLLRSEDPKWYKEDFIRNQNIETLRKSEGIISSTSTDFRLSSNKQKVHKMIDIYERHKSAKKHGRRIIFESTTKKLSPKMDLRNMKTVADFKNHHRHHVPTLPEHKKHIQNFRQKLGMVMDTLSIHTKNPYKILQSLASNLQPFYQKLPGNKDQRVNLPIKIEDASGNFRDLSIRINTDNIERHLLEKYSSRLLQNNYDSNVVLKKMTKEYQELLNKLVNKALVIRIPREYKVSLDDFNDFYARKSQDEIEAEIEEERKREAAAAEKSVQQQLMQIIEEQVNEVTETLIIPTEAQITDGEDGNTTDEYTGGTATMEAIATEAQTERAVTERAMTDIDLMPVPEEIKPQYSQRTYYEEEEDEEEFQRRQEEKRKKRQGASKYNQILHQGSAPVESIDRNSSEGTEDMRRNIQMYIEKLDHDIEQERIHPSHQSSQGPSVHHSSRQSQQFYQNHPESQASYPSSNSIQTGYLRHVSHYSHQSSGNTNNHQGVPRNPNSTPDTDLKNPSVSLLRFQDTNSSPNPDMLIINSGYDNKDGTTPSGNETGTNKSRKPHPNSTSTIHERSPRRERGSIGHDKGSDGRGSTDGRSDNESQGRFRKTKRSSVGTSASDRAKFIEYEKYDRATLIQMLLEAPSILDSDIKIKDHGDPIELPKDYKYESEKAKSLFTKVFVWHQQLNRDLRIQEAELHLEHVGSSDSPETESDDDDY